MEGVIIYVQIFFDQSVELTERHMVSTRGPVHSIIVSLTYFIIYFIHFYGTGHEFSVLIASANIEGSGEWAFAARIHKTSIVKGSDKIQISSFAG